MSDKTKVALAKVIAEQCSKALAGHLPEVQGAVLADLLATWLAGHTADDTDALREQLLHDLIETVRLLIPVNEAIALGAKQ